MRIELAHDLIAKKVYEKASQNDKDQARARNIVGFKFNLYQKAPDMLLSEKELALIVPYLPKLDLSPAQLDFINLCQNKIKWHQRKKYLVYSCISLLGISMAFTKMFAEEKQARMDNQALAQNSIKDIYNLTQQIHNVKSVEDLRTLKIVSETLQNHTLQNPNAINALLQIGADTTAINPAADTNQQILTTQLTPICISGQVKNEKQKPLPNVELSIGDMRLKTDQNGRYTFYILTDTSLLPQTMQLVATAANLEPAELAIFPRLINNQSFDLVLKAKLK